MSCAGYKYQFPSVLQALGTASISQNCTTACQGTPSFDPAVFPSTAKSHDKNGARHPPWSATPSHRNYATPTPHQWHRVNTIFHFVQMFLLVFAIVCFRCVLYLRGSFVAKLLSLVANHLGTLSRVVLNNRTPGSVKHCPNCQSTIQIRTLMTELHPHTCTQNYVLKNCPEHVRSSCCNHARKTGRSHRGCLVKFKQQNG